MRRTPARQSQDTRTARVEILKTYTLGGLLVYAALIPVIVALLAAPAVAGAFALGVGSAVIAARIQARGSTSTTTDDGDTASGSGRRPS